MATNMQKTIAKIKVEGVLKEIAFKTTGEQVVMADGRTAEAVIASILTSIANLPNDSAIDEKVKNSCDALYNKIMGSYASITLRSGSANSVNASPYFSSNLL